MEEIPLGTVVALLGFGLGLVFGATAQRTNFCTMGAISDAVLMGDWNRFRAWLLAIAVAIVGTQGLQLGGLIDLSKSIYQTANLGWAGASGLLVILCFIFSRCHLFCCLPAPNAGPIK